MPHFARKPYEHSVNVYTYILSKKKKVKHMNKLLTNINNKLLCIKLNTIIFVKINKALLFESTVAISKRRL